MAANPLNDASLEITPGDRADYGALAGLLSACYPEFVFDPQVLQAQDENNHALSLPMRRWVVRQDQGVVAYCEYRRMAENRFPARLSIQIVVHPGYRGRGLGGALYRLLEEHLPHDSSLSLQTTIRSEDTHSLGFLIRRGFVCEQSLQEWTASLLPPSMASRPFCDSISASAEPVICSVAELKADPMCNRKLYRLIEAIRQDTPPSADRVTLAYEAFEATYLEQPSFFPEMAFVAVVDGEYIGYSDLRDDGADGLLYNLTGVRREFRRQGVATALKREGLTRAQERGYTRLRTFCAAENTAIQRLNCRFGFEQTSAWTQMCRGNSHLP